jgi:hypothetical protein
MLKIAKLVSLPARRRPNSILRTNIGIVITLAWLVCNPGQAQVTNFTLGSTSLLEGPIAGSNSVVLSANPSTANWTATNNAAWLHLSAANQAPNHFQSNS